MKFFFKNKHPLLLVSFLVANAWFVSGQDIHFSQFNNSPANLNPALTGVFGGDFRFIANYRSQWQSVPVSYRTLSAAYDAKLFHPILGDGSYLGYGLAFNNDVAGDADLGWSKIAANLAYIRQLNDVFFVSLGTQFSLGQRSVSPQQLSYGEQWNGDLYDPDLPNSEVFGSTSRGIFSAAVGLNLRFQSESSRTKVDGGVGFFHLNQPNTSFFDDPATALPLKISPHVLGVLELNPRFDLRANALFSKQTSYRELVAGLAFRYHFSTEVGKELNTQIGISLRSKDAWIPSAELQLRNWVMGFSYDQNFSQFQRATNRRGGPEFFLQYIFKKVMPMNEHKACPIF